MNDAKVLLWGRVIGAVSWSEGRKFATFQYAPEFANSGIQVSPLMMPLQEFPYEFPSLNPETFRGLPGLLADSLPDKFGNAIIDAWLSSQGRNPASFNPVERLCYIGKRGMGALEYEPAILGTPTDTQTIEVAKLVALANKILDQRNNFKGVFSGGKQYHRDGTHPARGNIGRRSKGESHPGLESRHERIQVRAGG